MMTEIFEIRPWACWRCGAVGSVWHQAVEEEGACPECGSVKGSFLKKGGEMENKNSVEFENVLPVLKRMGKNSLLNTQAICEVFEITEQELDNAIEEKRLQQAGTIGYDRFWNCEDVFSHISKRFERNRKRRGAKQ